jgi:hypothetical protein
MRGVQVVTLHAPQLILIALSLIGMGISMARFGQEKTDRYDFIDVIIAPAIVHSLLWWGGFYGH